jgi:hypothetical protein
MSDDFRRGQRELASHRPDRAVRSLRKAVSTCPALRAGELSRNLYWLALALFRLDRPELAVKSLASAQKLRPRGLARSAYLLRVNDYGMCRRSSPELDDFYAFFSIKACAYLRSKNQDRFNSCAEKDAITRLIGDAWRSMSSSGKLKGASPSSKLSFFEAWPISYPLFGLDTMDTGKIVRADFRRGRRIHGEDPCTCGSGLPFMRCCGRTSSLGDSTCE